MCTGKRAIVTYFRNAVTCERERRKVKTAREIRTTRSTQQFPAANAERDILKDLEIRHKKKTTFKHVECLFHVWQYNWSI